MSDSNSNGKQGKMGKRDSGEEGQQSISNERKQTPKDSSHYSPLDLYADLVIEENEDNLHYLRTEVDVLRSRLVELEAENTQMGQKCESMSKENQLAAADVHTSIVTARRNLYFKDEEITRLRNKLNAPMKCLSCGAKVGGDARPPNPKDVRVMKSRHAVEVQFRNETVMKQWVFSVGLSHAADGLPTIPQYLDEHIRKRTEKPTLANTGSLLALRALPPPRVDDGESRSYRIPKRNASSSSLLTARDGRTAAASQREADNHPHAPSSSRSTREKSSSRRDRDPRSLRRSRSRDRRRAPTRSHRSADSEREGRRGRGDYRTHRERDFGRSGDRDTERSSGRRPRRKSSAHQDTERPRDRSPHKQPTRESHSQDRDTSRSRKQRTHSEDHIASAKPVAVSANEPSSVETERLQPSNGCLISSGPMSEMKPGFPTSNDLVKPPEDTHVESPDKEPPNQISLSESAKKELFRHSFSLLKKSDAIASAQRKKEECAVSSTTLSPADPLLVESCAAKVEEIRKSESVPREVDTVQTDQVPADPVTVTVASDNKEAEADHHSNVQEEKMSSNLNNSSQPEENSTNNAQSSQSEKEGNDEDEENEGKDESEGSSSSSDDDSSSGSDSDSDTETDSETEDCGGGMRLCLLPPLLSPMREPDYPVLSTQSQSDDARKVTPLKIRPSESPGCYTVISGDRQDQEEQEYPLSSEESQESFTDEDGNIFDNLSQGANIQVVKPFAIGNKEVEGSSSDSTSSRVKNESDVVVVGEPESSFSESWGTTPAKTPPQRVTPSSTSSLLGKRKLNFGDTSLGNQTPRADVWRNSFIKKRNIIL